VGARIMLVEALAPWQFPALASPATERFAWTSLLRHGRRPLGFMGRTLFDVSVCDPALPVWSEVSVHEVEGDHLVAAIRHTLRGDDPLSRHYAQRCEDIDSALGFLHAHDPLRDLPVEALYAAAVGLEGIESHLAAAACAARLRQTWHQILQTCFGNTNPSGALQ